MLDFPLVTLVIPSFNPGILLQETLQSVGAQTLSNYECIVVNDGSSDGSLKYFKAAQKNNKRLRLIQHKVTSGVSSARNSGIRAARGQFICFLDADDALMPNSLEIRVRACIAALNRSDRYAGSYCGSRAIEETFVGIPTSTPVKLLPVGFTQDGPACPFNANQPMFRADILRAAGGFDENLKQSEDFDLWLRIMRAGYWFAPANSVAVTYRKRSVSAVRKAPLDHLQTALELINSGEMRLSKDQLSWSRYSVTEPYAYFSAQHRKIKRTLEFCGINLASSDPKNFSVVEDLVRREIPDAKRISPPARPLINHILNGVRRQTGGHVSDFLIEEAGKITRLIEGISDNTVCAQTAQIQTSSRLWNMDQQRQYDYVFIPHKDYHVWTIALLREELDRRGISFVVVDISPQWREAGVRSMAAAANLPLVSLSEFILGDFRPRQIIVFNDWDPVTRPILAAAKTAGIAITAIVEGIQDYHDADVHWKRQAYQLSDTVLLPGEFDKRYFSAPDNSQKVIPVGVARVQSLRRQPAKSAYKSDVSPRVLINSNFSYGVLADHRDAWLTDAVEVVLAAGMTPVISRHPADKGELFETYITDMNFYECLDTCQATIQRFASGVLEAIARETPVYYFNPHGEKVDKFTADPMGAYCVIVDKGSLLKELNDWTGWEGRVKKCGPAFLDSHAGSATGDIYAETVNGLIAGAGEKADEAAQALFKDLMLTVDRRSGSLTKATVGGVALIPELENIDVVMTEYRTEAGLPQDTRVVVDKSSVAGSSQDSAPTKLKLLVQELAAIAHFS